VLDTERAHGVTLAKTMGTGCASILLSLTRSLSTWHPNPTPDAGGLKQRTGAIGNREGARRSVRDNDLLAHKLKVFLTYPRPPWL
jgi:hypothetical protein